jgi:DNA-binding NarL/FixJ family response regulator
VSVPKVIDVSARIVENKVHLTLTVEVSVQSILDGKLTRRESELLPMVNIGMQNKEIAARFNVSERTVKYHVSSLLKKVGVSNRRELTIATTKKTSAGEAA